MADTHMKDAKKDVDEKKKTDKKDEEPVKPKPPATPAAEIRANLALIHRGVTSLEPRFTNRVLRSLTSLRKKLTPSILHDVIGEIYEKDHNTRNTLLSFVPDDKSKLQDTTSMDVDTSSTAVPAKPAPLELVPESEVYLRLLIIHQLLKEKATQGKAKEVADHTVEKISSLNRRSMDPIAARVWYALERAYEVNGVLSQARPLYLTAQRTASLRHDDDTLASLINRLLRSYIQYSLYDQADKLVSKTTFPTSAGNPQYARYHYYLGRIRAVQLNYSEAHSNIQQAIRRAPQATSAPGFYQAVHKLSVVVELLMGDIPDRGLFRHPVLEKALHSYFEIVKAVRAGSLSQFQNTLTAHAAQFEADKTSTLIARLRQNVIKTGIRRLSLSYSRISLRDICLKLHLDSEEDAEYIVGKAIRDGVIDGRIVHERGWMECGVGKTTYGPEVAEVFSRRIGYCMELHNESVKAMRYPLNAHRKELADAEGAREREKELAKEIASGELDDDDSLGDY